MDLVALLVLGALALTGLVSASQAFAGFSNSAVITVWAMFILSEGLTRTGIANIIGNQVMRVAGRREFSMIVAIMVTAAESADISEAMTQNAGRDPIGHLDRTDCSCAGPQRPKRYTAQQPGNIARRRSIAGTR